MRSGAIFTLSAALIFTGLLVAGCEKRDDHVRYHSTERTSTHYHESGGRTTVRQEPARRSDRDTRRDDSRSRRDAGHHESDRRDERSNRSHRSDRDDD